MKIYLRYDFDIWEEGNEHIYDNEIDLTDEEEASFRESARRFEYWQDVIGEKITEARKKRKVQ